MNMRQTLLPVLEGLGVDLVLGGHSHNYERSYFINGHYGLANTFTDDFKLDLGDGDPAGDGAYRKANADGTDPNSGAVYVVNGSGSEFRTDDAEPPGASARPARDRLARDRRRRQHAHRRSS